MNTLMHQFELLLALGALGVFSFQANIAHAQVPGEDPVILTKRISNMQLPDGGGLKSRPMDNAEMPASLRAKVARFEAKSLQEDAKGFATDKDVTQETSSDGFKKTCIQEVGSNTSTGAGQTPGRAGQGNNQQIVVLRGDLVNICK